MGRLLLVLILAETLAASSLRADGVERRGTEGTIEGRITIDDAGVHVASPKGADHFVPWDRVRRVDAKNSPPGLDRWMPIAVELWRARSRVERNDTALAEPLFERLFERYRGKTHTTALVVAEGLLRCRLAHSAHARAVIPALEVARLRRAGVSTDSYAMLSPVLDESTVLCPDLAPAWAPTRALERLLHELAAYDPQGDAVVGALARLYRGAVAVQLGLAQDERADTEASLPRHPGVERLMLLVECTADDADRREAARERLRRAFADWPSWSEAWARFHIGLSLLRETGIGRQQRGLVSLLHVPARFGREQPYLAGLALAYTAEALEASGDTESAATLRAELAERCPDHPVRRAVDDLLGQRGVRSQELGVRLGVRERRVAWANSFAHAERARPPDNMGKSRRAGTHATHQSDA
ncbi:MAG: hypothetical protein ACYSTY_00590 [Planctomycetota bacterium]|jgi:hypothetical protein